MLLDELPLEIVLNISNYLVFSDKLQLMLCCKKLKDVIVKRSLFTDLNIPYVEEIVEAVVKKSKNKQLNGNQVKRLKLQADYLLNQLYRRFPFIFPNITELRNLGSSSLLKRDAFIIDTMKNWKDQITRLDKSYTDLKRLLEKYSFPQLVSLEILFYFDFHDREVNIPDINPFICIQNAPALLHLTLDGGLFHNTIDYLQQTEINPTRLLIINAENGSNSIFNTDRLNYLKKFTNLKRIMEAVDSLAELEYRIIISTTITSLDLCVILEDPNISFPLDILLSAFPLIKSLRLSKKYGSRTTISEDHYKLPRTKKCYPRLTSVVIVEVTLTEGAIDFLRTYLPNFELLILPTSTFMVKYEQGSNSETPKKKTKTFSYNVNLDEFSLEKLILRADAYKK